MRPELTINTHIDDFKDYYWLKAELIEFCRMSNLPSGGRKSDLEKRIYRFLKDGEIIVSKRIVRKKSAINELDLNQKIGIDYKNDENRRAFFVNEIGKHFKFNVQFMEWMKLNPDKLYSDAVNEWKRIIKERKTGKKSEISSQFEYNQYTRDFFNANPDLGREEAIICWKYKKSIKGHNRYEDSDLKNYKMEIKKIENELNSKGVMVLATSSKDLVTARSVSTIYSNGSVYFQTDNRMEKYQQISQNHHVALTVGFLQMEGIAFDIGKWDDNPDLRDLYKSKHLDSYNKYKVLDSEIVIEVKLKKIKKWEYINKEPFEIVFELDKKQYTKTNYLKGNKTREVIL